MVEFHLKCCDFPPHFLASQEVVFLLTLYLEFRLISSSLFMYSFIQQSLIQKLTEWQTENTQLTKDNDIIREYHRIKDDYEGQAVGAKDVIVAAFFHFEPVSTSSRLNVFHAAFVLVVACSGVRLALWLFLVLFYFV